MMRVLTIAISLTLGIAAGAIAGGQVTACQMDVQTGAGLNLADAAAGGGQVTFACPPGTVIRITRTHHLSVFTDVDGAGRVTLDAGDVTALFSASASADRIILRNIELRDGPSGFGFAGAGTSFGGLFFGPVTLELVKVTATLSRFPFVASAIRVSDSVFADNSGTVLRAPSIEIDGSRFSGNAGAPISPLLRGFGEGLEQGSAKIERTEFTSNGPIVWEGDISMRKATFAANASADRPGGALSALGTVEIANSRFVNNRAPDGGAIWFRGGSLTIRASTFEGNVADDKGGAIGVADDAPRSQIALRFIHFRANRARNGGAILLQSEPPGPGHTLTGSGINFAGNSASGSGGAIFALSGRIALERVLFLDNRAADSGGGILTSEFSDGVSLANAILARNQAPQGAAFLGHFLDLTNATVADNRGIALVGTQASAFLEPRRGRLSFANSVIGGNEGGNCDIPRFEFEIVDRGHNVQFPDQSCGATIPVGDPELDSFYVPRPGGILYGAGDDAICLATPVLGRDVYGDPRPQGHIAHRSREGS